MVPHSRILAAIALVARCSGDEEYFRSELTKLYSVSFPADLFGEKAFWIREVLEKLPIELQVAITTSQMHFEGDYTAMFEAAKVLEVAEYVQLGGSTVNSIARALPFVLLPPEIATWRRHPALRMALECMLLCDVPLTQICDDMRRMYGRTFEESNVVKFQSLFCDRTKLGDWSAYSRCVPQEELAFKHRLMNEPVDFVRWKLGVPVHLENDAVLDRMMSDAYFTERLMKHDARGTDPHGLPQLGVADLARIKLERDTVFKCMDRKLKMKELAGQQSGTTTLIHQQIAKIQLEFAAQEMPMVDELNGG